LRASFHALDMIITGRTTELLESQLIISYIFTVLTRGDERSVFFGSVFGVPDFVTGVAASDGLAKSGTKME
jgi:hypothetical protein